MNAPAVLTFAYEAECGLLGALLVDNDVVDRISVRIKPAHFFVESHREVYGAIQDVIASGKVADFLSVSDHLETSGDLDRVGGMSFLAELANNTGSTAAAGRYAEIVVERAQLRELIAAASETMDDAVDIGASVIEKVQRAQGRFMSIAEAAAEGRPQPTVMADILRAYCTEIQSRQDGTSAGISTGFIDIDAKLNGGLRPGQLVFIAARPAMGKTSLALQVATNVAKAGEPVLVCSQEMPKVELMDRVVSSQGRIPLSDLISGQLHDDQWAALTATVASLHDVPLHIDDQGGLTLADVVLKARKVKRTGGLSLLVIDYIQLMSGSGDNRNAELERISRGLKQLAVDLGIPIVVLSQLSRECEKRPNKRPVMSDMRDSGALEQDADVVMFVYRDEVYNPDSPDKGTAEILIRKNRQGSIGDVRLSWAGALTSFGSLDIASWSADRAERKETYSGSGRGAKAKGDTF
jgi:replicative DNA helicase